MYIVDLAYCGLVGMRNMPEEGAHAFLYAEAPRMLFPFARRVVADAVRDAGFAPLMVDPVDFNGIYAQQLAARRAEEAGGGAPVAPVTGNA
jgi:preprotein translocase subunit SecB